MKVYIHYRTTDEPWGGGNTFLRALAGEFLRRPGVDLVTSPRGADIFLLNGGSSGQHQRLSVREIEKFMRPFLFRVRTRFVYRVDGFRSIYADMKDPMDPLQLELIDRVDHTIFQSRFSLDCARQLGSECDRYSIVHNAVDGDLFRPGDAWDGQSPLRLVFSSWSDNPNKGFEVFARMSEIEGIHCTSYGKWCDSVDPRRVEVNGPLATVELARELQKHHVCVHPSRDDACSNSVLEAMASGLPVIYSDTGGTPEIAGGHGIPLRDGDGPEEVLDRMKADYDVLRGTLIDRRSQFLIAEAADGYLKTFNEVLRA